ncbi:MAG TPA: hypothetical protein VGF45_01235, partial [Polyangia bacterium]
MRQAVKSIQRHHTCRTWALAVGLVLATHASARATPAAAPDFTDRFSSFRARTGKVAQLTPPGQTTATPAPTTTVAPAPGAQSPQPPPPTPPP